MDLPTTMTGLCKTAQGPGHLELREVPVPSPGPHEVLIEVKAAGICGTDLHIFRGEFGERVKFPAMLGHEFGGEIVDVGKSVDDWQVGDRVAVDPNISCHGCPPCLEGHPNACRTLKLLGIDVDGGFGQYVAVPKENLYRLPESVPMKHASMVEMYGLGHHILRRGRVQLGLLPILRASLGGLRRGHCRGGRCFGRRNPNGKGKEQECRVRSRNVFHKAIHNIQ